jgi:K+-transporting ATPase KdpF subunit
MANLDSVWAYAVAGLIALVTTAYLFAAMLFPEKF